ncbi:STAS domain-containing protein [Paramaledivibacter caminithermalis]|jgi:anti-sigma B factor antagonist|uniref:Anti-anti-sigma factor n=1 Tax=Paramaledivibacter caminithermalis (strain DSM 15212 / CIP 107654 / DViRD3) TaxID=1121301 RepID=A0A1M6NMP8_PARC5|nr:STAS domain-containing protein [Paramaledivibacter caminithermalis]SHJ96990.1 anti-anti-sigma factor [Paramaledivibacter caminithermalis DSM 15212]
MKTTSILIPENFAVDEASEFREKLIKLTDKGEKYFSLDFSNCSFIDSTGLGVIVSIYNSTFAHKNH